jgi:hypothetical protein
MSIKIKNKRMNKKILSVKDRQELEKTFQILGRGIGKIRINEKGEIFVFDEKKSKKEYKIGQI